MLNKKIILNRLAIIKRLYKQGIEQSQQPDPVSSFSVLSFHDCIEMFLRLICESKNIKADKFTFIEYWNNIPSLSLKESCKSLNTVRVNIKHKGILPSKSDIESIRITTSEFLKHNVFEHFSIDFDSISLINLVKYKVVKEFLNISQNFLNSNDLEESVENSALAFDELLSDYELSKTSSFDSPFNFGNRNYYGAFSTFGISDTNTINAIEGLEKSISSISEALKIVSVGIDYRKYIKFKILTPHIYYTSGGRQIANNKKMELNMSNCQFCIDFIIDVSLHLQDFDFRLEELTRSEF